MKERRKEEKYMDLNLLEIRPVEYDKGRKVIHKYSKVKTSDLTAKRVRDLYINLGFKIVPVVTSLKEAFLITFFPKPPILISKEDGRLYTFKGNWDIKEAQHQASLVMRVLAEYSLVEDHKRISLRRRKK